MSRGRLHNSKNELPRENSEKRPGRVRVGNEGEAAPSFGIGCRHGCLQIPGTPRSFPGWALAAADPTRLAHGFPSSRVLFCYR
jgi:hypothetical protein